MKTPYQQGYDAWTKNSPAPAYPNGLSTWAERLFNRGWEAARRDAESTT